MLNRWLFRTILGLAFMWPSEQAASQTQNIPGDDRTMRLSMSGPFVVVDADTFMIRDQPVQLFGITAPGLRERCNPGEDERTDCGVVALSELLDIIRPLRQLECTLVGTNRGGNLLAKCNSDSFALASGEQETLDLAEILVLRGFARFDKSPEALEAGRYRVAERRAQVEGAGFWSCTAATPRRWERDKTKICDLTPFGGAR